MTAIVRANPTGDALRARLAAAAPGATVRVAAGVYDGPFTIEKPVRLLGAPGAVLQGDRRGCVVAIRAPDVELAGFVVRGSGRNLSEDQAAIHITGARAFVHDDRIVDMLHGVYVRKANDCRIVDNVIFGDGAADDAIADPVLTGLKAGDAASAELCSAPDPQDRRGNGIHLWNSSGHLIAGNTIRGTRDGIYFSFTSRTTTRDNTITRVRYGLHYMYSDENTFERNVFSDNAAGAALMYSKGIVLRGNRFVGNRSHRAYGLLLQSVDDTRIEDNVIAGNTLGLFLENSNNDTLRANRVAGNYIGIRISESTAGCRFFENTFADNIHPIEASGSDDANLWAVAGRGNFWDGAVTLDLNRDGIADLPHRESDLFGALRRDFPAIGLLSASPGERLLRLIYNRLALPGLPGVIDPKPLIVAQASSPASFKMQAGTPALLESP
ncbi:MAG TPA: NosD domain-containing protein [Opitutus sp.]|nr:NosD domain-containing protein [Opitutus sp.]